MTAPDERSISDIVARLRAFPAIGGPCAEAADEIDRLRASLKSLLPNLLADVGAKGGLTVHSRERCMAIVKDALKVQP